MLSQLNEFKWTASMDVSNYFMMPVSWWGGWQGRETYGNLKVRGSWIHGLFGIFAHASWCLLQPMSALPNLPPKTFILWEKINPSSSWIKAINISQSCFQTVELVEPRKHVLGASRRSSFAFYEKVTRDFSFLLLITTLSFPLGNNSFYSVK